MGNHEYCEDCGENDFHNHRPCDPAKVAARKAAEKQVIERKVRGHIKLEKLKKKLATEEFSSSFDYYGNLVVSWN